MSVLHFKARPWTIFDPAIKSHRRWYSEFVTHRGWGNCPYRFIVPEDHGDLITMIQRKLVEYYVQREFAPLVKIVVKKPQKRARKKVIL
jgi:hypothetical protein